MDIGSLNSVTRDIVLGIDNCESIYIAAYDLAERKDVDVKSAIEFVGEHFGSKSFDSNIDFEIVANNINSLVEN